MKDVPETKVEVKELDFWVGEWDLKVGGRIVGTNSVEKLHDGSGVLVENWTGRGGSSGKSLNFYSIASKKWRYISLADDLTKWEMIGEYHDSAMHYTGAVTASGKVSASRVTVYNLEPGIVRHTEYRSSNDGQTWDCVWDAVYHKKR
jgi:hypothetical protein